MEKIMPSGKRIDVEQLINMSRGAENIYVDDFSHKHALQVPWTLWVLMHSSAGKGKSWSENLQPMHEFSHVEDFWCMYNNIHSPRSVQGADYCIFKKGVTPAWEDTMCKGGGRWIAKFDKLKARTLDEIWLNLTLAMIGEAFDENCGSKVCGAVVSSRSKASKVSLWISSRDENEAMAIGQAYHNLLKESMDSKLTVLDVAFEDFSKQAFTYTISEPIAA